MFYRITRGGGPTTYLHYEILVKYKIWIFSFLDRYNWLNKFSVDEPAEHQLFMMLIFNNYIRYLIDIHMTFTHIKHCHRTFELSSGLHH